MTLVRLGHEKQLLVELKGDTLRIIRSCDDAEPIRRLLTCHDIISLTLDINGRFPKKEESPLICDVDALRDLRKITSELFVYYGSKLPMPDFSPFYITKVDRLLWFYGLPPRS
jgi:hypothetical protein